MPPGLLEHLKSDFRYHSEGLPTQKLFGEEGLELTTRCSPLARLQRTPRPRRLGAEIEPIQLELRALVAPDGKRPATVPPRLREQAAQDLARPLDLLTHAAVQPTNNAAERSLRGPVIHRKLSHGTRTQDGERFIERALSASVTCRLQRRSLFAYLSDLLIAHPRGDPLPPSPEPGE